MGASNSTVHDLKKNTYLQQFSGRESISYNDPFWNQLLSFSFTPPRTSSECQLLDETVQPLLENLLSNNSRTGNFGALIRVFLARAAELKASAQCENNIFTWQAYNVLFILRCSTKYLIETITEENILKEFQARPKEPNAGHKVSDDDSNSLLELFINALVEIVVDVPAVDFTYAIHVEAINLLLVLLSIQMFSSVSASKSQVYRSIMQGKCSIHSFLLTKTLLQHYIRQEKCPVSMHHHPESGSIILGLAWGLWNALTLGYGKGKVNDMDSLSDAILADQSLLLLMVLVNHCTSDKDLPNPYRQALLSFTNSQDQQNRGLESAPSFKVDYSKLYETLCCTLLKDQSTLLLYLLMHQNMHFKTYVLSRTNIDALVVPMLKILYYAPEKSCHHVYMALIILLILSEDDLFNEAIHGITLKNISWYAERSISEVSLGGLLVLMVVRTIQYNITKMRDKYLHTNCLAALANMSGHFKGLHPYVCQCFLSLFENLSKRLTRVMTQLRSDSDEISPESEDEKVSELMQDLSILEEVLRMVLEILNSCLSARLTHNPNLVYSLLYKRHIFEPFRTHPTFQDVLQNLDTVLTYFSARLDAAEANLSVSEVSQVIEEATWQWTSDRLKKFPELKFKYVEEDQPEEFFIPYVWSLVYQSSNLYWNSKNIVLFNAHRTS